MDLDRGLRVSTPEPCHPPAAPAPSLTAGLRGFERLSTRLMTTWNHTPATKRAGAWFVRAISHPWIHAAVGNRLQVTGAEHIRGLRPPRGLLLVANHRTFWDMYVATSVFTAHSDGVRDLYFPVRRRFFYTHPAGVLLNFAVSGGSMWPPMASGFDRARRDLAGLEALARRLDAPNTLSGIHPEGTRGHDHNPLVFLPPKGGAGRLVQACHPETRVLPFFLVGLTNDFVAEVVRNFRRPGHRGPPIRIAFGAPIRAGDLRRDLAPRELSAELLIRVRRLGEALPPLTRDP